MHYLRRYKTFSLLGKRVRRAWGGCVLVSHVGIIYRLG
jgi:hypothetical protein